MTLPVMVLFLSFKNNIAGLVESITYSQAIVNRNEISGSVTLLNASLLTAVIIIRTILSLDRVSVDK